MRMRLRQLPLPWLPEGAAGIAPGIRVVPDPDGGGTAWVHGMATFSWAAGDWAGRKLAAVQLAELTGADKKDIAAAFGTDAASSGGGARPTPGTGWPGCCRASRARGPVEADRGGHGPDPGAGRGRAVAGGDRPPVRGVGVRGARRAGPGGHPQGGRVPA